MPQTFLNTGTQAGNFEDLANFIQRISYELTPFFSMLGKDKAKSILHEWVTEEIASGGPNAVAEGDAPTFSASDITVRVRRNNPVQILRKKFSVSGTQDAVNKAGLGQSSEYEHQKDLKFKEIAKDSDFELIRSTKQTRDADAGTVGKMDGLLQWSSGTRARDGQGQIIKENIYNELVEAIFESSGVPADTILAPGFQRRAITNWSTPIRRMEHEDTMTNKLNKYDSDYGTQIIVHDLHMPSDTIAVFSKKFLKAAWLRPVHHIELGVDGDRRRGIVLSELTLRVDNPNTVGKITNLATSGS